jgi:hypothetical protein
MKITLPVLALSLVAFASPAFASLEPSLGSTDGAASVASAGASISESSRYFAADSAISFGTLLFAATGLMAANVAGRRRRAFAAATAKRVDRNADWRRQIYVDLDADLQRFSRQLRRAA